MHVSSILLLPLIPDAVLTQVTILPPRPPSPIAVNPAANSPDVKLSDVINVSPASSISIATDAGRSRGALDWSVLSPHHQLICDADGLTFNLATLCDIFCNRHRLGWLQCQKDSMVCKQSCRCIARQWLPPNTVAKTGP